MLYTNMYIEYIYIYTDTPKLIIQGSFHVKQAEEFDEEHHEDAIFLEDSLDNVRNRMQLYLHYMRSPLTYVRVIMKNFLGTWV